MRDYTSPAALPPISFRPTPEQEAQLAELVASGWFGTRNATVGRAIGALYQQWAADGRPHKAQADNA